MKSFAYTPLDGLVDLACRDGVDIRPTLLRVLTDLYVQRPTHSADEETQYVNANSEPATVIILPVIRIERVPDGSNGLEPDTGNSSGRRRRRRIAR